MRRPAVDDPLWLGQYRVLAELARDETTRVLLGSGPDDRLVALTLAPRQSAEAAALSAVLEADPDASTPWWAQEFVPGPSLRDVPDALPEPAVLRLAAGIAADLTRLHSAGLAHGKLTPSHIRLTSSGARLIARATGDDPADDVFALGTLLAAKSALPEALRPCLAENPADRPTAAELLEALRPSADPWPPAVEKLVAERTAELAQYLDGQHMPLDDSVIYQVADTPPPPRRAAPRRRILISALALAIAGLAAWIAWPDPPAPPPAPPSPLTESGFLVARGHPQYVTFNHDGRLLATANADFTIDVLDVVTRKPVGPRIGPFPETGLPGMTFRSDGITLATAQVKDNQFTARTWDSRTGREIGEPLVLENIDRGGAWPELSPDGSVAAVPMASPRRTDLWRVADRTRIGSIDTPAAFRVSAFSPDGRTLAVYQRDGHSAHTSQLDLWDTASLKTAGKPIVFSETEPICCLAFRPDGRTLITTSAGAGAPPQVRQWDTATHEQLRPAFSLAPAPAYGEMREAYVFMASAGLDDQHLLALAAGTVTVRDLDGQQDGASLPGILSFAVSPDRKTIATTTGSTADTTVHLWRKP
ncbi:protein kinase family protein [Amycolatopsis sp. La24]|uniref:protein kinase family protein n=1 Tax=Amycolatopsis sp. La24 TaxID=3028304 RepID=UPI0023AF2797|nr:protein kinase family protein [Amycolatopsis sp. La24]